MEVETLKRKDYIRLMRFLEKSYNHSYNFFPLKYPHVWEEETTDYEGGIGGVATLQPCRGKGFMTSLMRHTLKIMEERGYPFSILLGDRQRYGVFGYETCGREVVFYVST